MPKSLAPRPSSIHQSTDEAFASLLGVIIEGSTDAIFAKDLGGRYILVNGAAARFIGREARDILGRRDGELFPPESADETIENDRRVLATGSTETYESATTCNGVTVRYLSTKFPYRNADGEIAGIVGIARDVTLEKSTRAQLMTADRLAAVGRLAAGVAHEINNPLAYVVMNLEEIGDVVDELAAISSTRDEPVLARAIERLRTSMRDASDGADRVTKIVRDIGTFSRAPDDESPAPVDVRDVVRSSVRLTDNTVRHCARVDLELGVAPLVLANEARLAQVVVNLLINAAQAIADPATADPATERGVVTIRTFEDESGRTIIEVVDNGIGIAPEHLAHVFEPFFTTKPPGTGTGLGLSVCLGIVRHMGGDLTVTSTLGRGSTFRMTMPAARDSSVKRGTTSDSPTNAGATQQLDSTSSPVRRARVLLVDDEVALSRALSRVLSRDYDVAICSNGEEALALFTEGERFDLVLCDLTMPGLSGEELYAIVAVRDPLLAARFLFLTGGAMTERSRVFVEEMNERCLAKPIGSAKLRAAVEEALRRGGT